MSEFKPTNQPFTFVRVDSNDMCEIIHYPSVYIDTDCEHEFEVGYRGPLKRCIEIVAVCEAINWNCDIARMISDEHAKVCTLNELCNSEFNAKSLANNFALDSGLARAYYLDVIRFRQTRGTNVRGYFPYITTVARALKITHDDAANEIQDALGDTLAASEKRFTATRRESVTYTYNDYLHIRKTGTAYIVESVGRTECSSLQDAEHVLFEYAIQHGLWQL